MWIVDSRQWALRACRTIEPATPARELSLAEKVCQVFWRMPETLFECAGPRLAGQTRFLTGRRKIPTSENPLDHAAGFPVVRPYEAGHMSSFPASPNRPGTPETATTVSSSGVAALLPPPPDTATAVSSPGAVRACRAVEPVSPARELSPEVVGSSPLLIPFACRFSRRSLW
jgi:hypothetical protein